MNEGDGMTNNYPTAEAITARFSAYAKEQTPAEKEACLKAAAHWQELAESEEKASYTSAEKYGVARHLLSETCRAETYRKVAHCMRIQAETGIALCTPEFIPYELAREQAARHGGRRF